jgi:altronate hydrolase
MENAPMADSQHILKLHLNDNVGIARGSIPAGTLLDGTNVTTTQEIPAGHKVALNQIAKDDELRRYGQIIGLATTPIFPGEHVHTHNLAMAAFDRDYAFGEGVISVTPPDEPLTFMGIKRPDGRVATRNYIAVISTVNCSATVAKKIAQHFNTSARLDEYPNIDGIVPVTHSFGCCVEHNGEGLKQLRRTIAGFVTHANFAGAVVIGLGCEANQLKPLLEAQNAEADAIVVPLVMQELGGTQKTIDAGIAAVEKCSQQPIRLSGRPSLYPI